MFQESCHQRGRSGVTWWAGICWELGRAPVSLTHCLGCPPCSPGIGAMFTALGSDSSSLWRQRKSTPHPGPWPLQLLGRRPYRLHEGNAIHCQSICFDLNVQFPSSVWVIRAVVSTCKGKISCSEMAACSSWLGTIEPLGIVRCRDSKQLPLHSTSCLV